MEEPFERTIVLEDMIIRGENIEERCKSHHSAGGICRGILVSRQPGGEISETTTAQIVMQIPPAEWLMATSGAYCLLA